MDSQWQNHLKNFFEVALNRPVKNWSETVACFYSHPLKSREHLIVAGEEWRDIFFVAEGLLRVYYVDNKGDELTQHFYQAGEVISPLEDPKGHPCPFYIQSLDGNTRIIRADYADLHREDFDNRDWMEVSLFYLKKLFLKNAKHEAQLLLGNAESRYHWFCREYADLQGKLTQNQIASFLGVSPVTISRIKNNR